jgi:predicted HTH domain antitoxin
MAMESLPSFTVSLPKDFVPIVESLEAEGNMDEKVRLSLSIGLFVGRSVTLARAAELSGRSLNDFIAILDAFHIPWMDYTDEQLQEDELAVDELLGTDDEESDTQSHN